MHRRPIALLLLVFSLAAVTGCGDEQGGGSAEGGFAGTEQEGQSVGGGGGTDELSASDTADVLGARRTIDARCGADTRPALGQDVGEAVQTIESVVAQYPDKVYETGNEARALEMERVTKTVVEQLRKCGLTAEADRLAAAIPN